jgi:hypothetical protein
MMYDKKTSINSYMGANDKKGGCHIKKIIILGTQ